MSKQQNQRNKRYWVRRDSRHLLDAVMLGQTVVERYHPVAGSAHEDMIRARCESLNEAVSNNRGGVA